MEKLWEPSPEHVAKANLTCFTKLVENKYHVSFSSYSALHRWSVEHPEQFWSLVWQFGDVKASKTWEEVLVDKDKMLGAKWFTGAKLNFAENLLRYRDDKIAIVFNREDGLRTTLTYKELYQKVCHFAAGLRKLGIEVGDRVVGFLPNCPEAIIAMLGATACGAVWSSCSPDFGPQGVLDRFGQIKPKVLLTAKEYFYNGKKFESLSLIEKILPELPELKKVIVISESFDDFLEQSTEELVFEQPPFDHPIYILYSSGTTGVPKCIVHGAGGTLLQHLKEHVLHVNLKRDDVFFYYTTCGWMMWNWLVSGLAVGATLVLYDGAPFFPNPKRLLDLIDQEKITVFGVSAKYLASLEKEPVIPKETHHLKSLKTILSTGSPLLPESFDYVYRDIKKDVQLSSISGGTDIVSCFAGGNPLLPVFRGELQCLGLGMDVKIFNSKGQAVVGEMGELVCTSPFPCMPVYFWNDENDRKYREAYFNVYPNIWRHGDYAMLTERGTLVIYGRSDAVLNPGGVRIGTAEIYRQVEKLEEVLESLVVGQQWQGDERVILFVKLRPNTTWTEELETRIRKTIRDNTTPRHVPAKIIPIADIPKTLNGKIAELAVRNILHGKPVTNKDALANPESLELYGGLKELQN